MTLSRKTRGGSAKGWRLRLPLLLAAGLTLAGPTAQAQEKIKDAISDRLGLETSEPQAAPRIVNGIPFQVRFDSQVRGLAAGAPVEIRGIAVGAVEAIDLAYDAENNSFAVLVSIVLQPDLFPAMGPRPQTAAETYDAVDALIKKGLRAKLASQQLLGGTMVIELDIMEDRPPAVLGRADDPPLIPSGPSQAEEIKERLRQVIAKLAEIPLDDLLTDAKETLASLKALAEGPELKEALANLRDSSAALEAFVEGLDGRLDGAIAGLQGTLATARETLASIQRAVGDRSPLLADIRRLLRDLDGAARSLRLMADYLERHPDALLRGKKEIRQ